MAERNDTVLVSGGSMNGWWTLGMLLGFGLGSGGCGLSPSQLAELVHHHPGGGTGGAPHVQVEAGCPPSASDAGAAVDSSDAGSTDGAAGSDAQPSQFRCGLPTGTILGFCAPRAPFNWSGPGKLMTGDSPDNVPACPFDVSSTFATGAILGTQPPTCQGCTCGAPQGLACGPASVGDFFWDSDCVAPCSTFCFECGSACAMKGSNCANHGSLAMNRQVLPASLVGGSCTPSSPPAAPPAVAYAVAARACLGSFLPITPSCGAGQGCTSTVGKTCLFHKGDDLQCPHGPYTERSVFYGRTDDSRACTSCSCGGPKGVTCPTRIEVFSNGLSGSCTGTITETIETTTACLDLRQFPNEQGGGSLHFVSAQPSGVGSCTPASTETGSLSQGLPFTACCMPSGD